MKVLLAAPHMNQERGNAVTVRRILLGLNHLNIEPEIISTTEMIPSRTLPPADLIHGFHARRFQEFVNNLNEPVGPYVITMTGTDLNHDLFDKIGRELVLECTAHAHVIHVFNSEAKCILANAAPHLSHKIHVIHQGINPLSITKSSLEANRPFTFFLPAGIRKVKNIPYAIQMLLQLKKCGLHFNLLLAGPILEETEGQLVLELVQQNRDWIYYAGAVPHTEMGTLYEKADVVLNSSITEGQPAAILEGMQAGLPVLVSGNNGNRSIVRHNETGLIYETDCQFLSYAEQLMVDAPLRKRLANTASQFIARAHSSLYEASALLDLYKSILHSKI